MLLSIGYQFRDNAILRPLPHPISNSRHVAHSPQSKDMRDAQKVLNNGTGREGQSTEEYELDSFEASPNPPTAEPSIIPATEDKDKNSKTLRGAVKSIARPFHIHYVPISAARDHLANERVFLGYIRTASALANFAVTILQLYRLKHDPAPKGKLSDYDLGVPLATTTLLIAATVALAGTWRFFACQDAMALRNQIETSGRVVWVFTPLMALVRVLLPHHNIVLSLDC